MRKRLRMFALIAGFISVPLLRSADSPNAVLSTDQRVAAQKAIEQVYWDHRVWPKENRTAKPPLSAVLSDADLRDDVEDSLRKSNALNKYWHRPLTAAQLQAEVNRMAATTRSPLVLRELFASLGNDPRLIAETLGRQKLVDRLIRNWFASDERFHGELKRKVEAALAACGNAACLSSMGGEYREITWSLRAETERGESTLHRKSLVLDAEEWTGLLQRLADRVGGTRQSLTIMKPSRLEDTPDAFVVTAVLSQDTHEARTATVTWPKLSFDEWWRTERRTLRAESEETREEFTLPSVEASGCAADTWPLLAADPLPLPRRNHTSIWTGTEMIVWGGIAGVSFNTGGRYDPSTDTWAPTSTGANVPAARHWHTAVWTGREMIVWGGIEGTAFNTGGRYDPSTDTWAPVSTGANVPGARYLHTAVWTGTEMIVWGGVGGGFADGGGRYDPLTDSWTPVSTGVPAPAPRNGHTAVWTGREMIVWGGGNTGGRYNPSTDSWLPTSIGPNVPAGRSGHTAIWTGTEMIVWGGSNGAFFNDGGRYDPATDAWKSTATGASAPAGRDQHAAVWTGTEMVVWGGRAYDPFGNFAYLNTGGRYDPSSDTWLPVSTGPNVPAGRYEHTGVWTGTEMLVWGGDEPSVGNLNSGGRYDPSVDAWAPTSTGGNVPSPRRFHSSVWTGAEMIVWGGGYYDGSSHQLNSGGRYDPATDSWTPTSMGANVPPKRIDHAAVWTGTKMIVWGGGDYDRFGHLGYLNTGARYDPSSDTWTPTSTGAGVPAARRRHSAVWAGRLMIVWGGSNSTYLTTGGRYDPATDAWTPTSTPANVPLMNDLRSSVWTGTEMIVWGGAGFGGAILGGRYNPSTDAWATVSAGANSPKAQYGHSAVWTGADMIVWGGSYFDTTTRYLNTGGRYNPATDAWTPMSTGANVPVPRSAHTAIWTGSDMIVWGGAYYDGAAHYLNSGGRYDPFTDTWTPTSTGANAPAARGGHSAAWTGTGMIVWGGYDGASEVGTGGLYCACTNGMLYYPDADGDGYGNPAIVSASCDGAIPAGHTPNRTDCDDANPFVNPAALETCNAIDDDCDRIVDDVPSPGAVMSVVLPGGGSIEWVPLAAAQSYDVVYGDLQVLRANAGDFSTATQGCLADDTAATSAVVDTTPGFGQGVWYLVRGNNCGGAGSYDGDAGQIGSRDAAIAASSQACP